MANSKKYFANGMCKSFNARPTNFKGIMYIEITGVKRATGEDKPIKIFVQIDKNNQVCDCTRVGTVFDRIKGRPVDLFDPIGRIVTEISELVNDNEDTTLDVIDDERGIAISIE